MPPRVPGRPRRALVALSASLATASGCLLSLTSCSALNPQDPAKHPAIRSVAEAFATAAPTRSLDHIPLTPDVPPTEATRRLAILLAGTENLTGRATVTAIEPYSDDTGDHARATLRYRWSLSHSHPWEYDATLTLDRRDDAWRARYAPEAVVPQLQPGERLVVTTAPAPPGRLLAADHTPLPDSLVNNQAIIGGPTAPPTNGVTQALFGGPALRIDAATGGHSRPLFTARARTGTPVVSTVDPALQRRVAQALAGRRTPSSALIMDPRSGAIQALATGAAAREENLATRGLMAPGSAFAPVTALSAIRAGVPMKRPTSCPASVIVGAEPVYADPGLAPQPPTAAQVLALGCSTGMAQLAADTSTRYLAEAAAALGLNTVPALGIAAAVGGLPGDGGAPTNQLNSAGQGQVRVSPLGMATMLSSVLKGSAVSPVLVPPEAMPAADLSSSDVVPTAETSTQPRLSRSPRIDVLTPRGRAPGSAPTTSSRPTTPAPAASVSGPQRPLTAGEAAALRSLFGERAGRPSVGAVPQPQRVTVVGTSYDEQRRPYAWAMTGTTERVIVVVVAGEQAGVRSALPLLQALVR